jgi:hypothetical protein
MVQVVTAARFASAGMKVACFLLRSDGAVWRQGQTGYATFAVYPLLLSCPVYSVWHLTFLPGGRSSASSTDSRL